jgi:hypothetical protein
MKIFDQHAGQVEDLLDHRLNSCTVLVNAVLLVPGACSSRVESPGWMQSLSIGAGSICRSNR